MSGFMSSYYQIKNTLGEGSGFIGKPTNPSSQVVPGACVLWLRADQGITIGTGVSQWNDLSGNGNNVTQATGSKQPTYNATDAGYNVMPSLSFLAANSQALVSGTISSITQPYTIIVVGQGSSVYGTFIQGLTNDSGIYFDNIQQLNLYAGTSLPSSAVVSSKCVMAGIFAGAISTSYKNSSTIPVATGSTNTDAFESNIVIGDDGLSAALTGKIAEVLIYSGALTTAQLRAVFTYLGTRYNIATS